MENFFEINRALVAEKKLLYLLAVAIAGLFTSCGGGNVSNESKSAAVSAEVFENDEDDIEVEEEDYPKIVMEGLGFHLELPASADDVTCTLVTSEELAELREQGYNFITRPLNVTRNGSNHVQLSGVATVSFDIPEDFPKDQYDELVGVLITDEGPEYKIPDYYALREGKVKFETSHFSTAGASQKKNELREQFIEKVALNGWGRNMNNKMVEPTWREQLNKFANDHCLGKEDLAGIAMRELFGENDIVKIGLDIVNAHDMENAGLEDRMWVASENMIKVAEAKLMSHCLKMLKEDDNKKVQVIDEFKSNRIREVVYKTELKKIESRRNKIIGIMEDHFSVKNVEDVCKLLGDNPSVEKCYIYACEYIGNFALDQWKSKVEDMVPYIKIVKVTAKGVEIWKKFWASTQMNDLYKKYKENADETGGFVSDDIWTSICFEVGAPKFLHGMSLDQIKEKLDQRYRAETELNAKKEELRAYIDMIDTCVNMNSGIFELKHFDYVQRLTVVNNLINRFKDELLDKNGDLIYYDNGYRQVRSSTKSINEQLCYVVNIYLYYYPDREKFYKWLSKNGYYSGRLEDEHKKLTALLWKEEKINNPEIWIQIKETLGENSGSSQYWGRTIALATDGKPYMGWHAVVNSELVDDENGEDNGWSFYVLFDDESVDLLQYKEIGMPNEVLVYADENDFRNSRTPLKTYKFKADTTGGITEVDLSKGSATILDYVFDGRCMGWTSRNYRRIDNVNSALEDAFSKVHLNLLSTGDDFTFTTSGEYNGSSSSTHIDLTMTGSLIFKMDEASGTCSISATIVEEDKVSKEKTTITLNMNCDITSFDAYEPYNYCLRCNLEGPMHIKTLEYWKDNKYVPAGITNEIDKDGALYIDFKPADSNY